MPLHETPTITTEWTTELEIARALFANGDYDDVLKVVEPLLLRQLDALSKFGACQLKACVHSERQEWQECLDVLRVSGPLIDDLPADLRAKYHGQRALAHRNLNQTGAAILDYEAARDAALDAGDELILAGVQNNLAAIYGRENRFDEAIAEVDAAIRIATRLGEEISLGRYYDNKAQVLIMAKRYSEALTYSKKAVALLLNHPAGQEARFTHGLALIGVGAGYLDEPKSIEQFRARHDAAKMIDVELSPDLVRSALARSDGHVLGAAQLLNVSHSAVIKWIGKCSLKRAPKRRRAKPLIVK